jgi:AcrR family transcriptional regulator
MARKNLSAAQAAAADRLLEHALPHARHASRRNVLRHALTLFNANGVEATTIDDLRKASGQSVGTIYHHFRNKEGVVAALFFVALDDQSRAIASRIEGLDDGHAVVEALIEATTEWITAQPECAYFVFLARDLVAQGPYGPELTQRLIARYTPIDEILARDAAAGRILPLHADLIPALVLGATEFYARSWLAGRRQAAPTTHAQRFATAAWRSLTA